MRILRPVDLTGVITSSVPIPVVSPGVDPDPSLWAAETTYAIGDQVRYDTRRYRSRVSGHVGKTPATEVNQWLDIGAVNQQGMFDKSLGTATAAADEIVVTLSPTSYIDTLSLMGVDAQWVRVEVLGTDYNELFSMIQPRAVTNMWEYRFEPIDWRKKLLIQQLPVGSGAQYRITIGNPGLVARCILLVAGLMRQFGNTEFGLEIGIKDYSIKTVDQWGGWTMEDGGYSDRISMTADLPNNLIDALHKTLSAYKTTPVVWVASPHWEAAHVYGTYRDFGVVIPNAKRSKCRLEIEGFTYV